MWLRVLKVISTAEGITTRRQAWYPNVRKKGDFSYPKTFFNRPPVTHGDNVP